MNKKILAVIVLAIVGVGAALIMTNRNSTETASTSTATDNSSMQMQSSSSEPESSAYKQFAALKGEDYDRMFISNMLAHHQGAIDMAELVLTNAKHEELKTLANAIIASQSAEQKTMLDYQSRWGYPATSGDAMVDHSSMGMESDMEMMTAELKDKMGDEFDKAFLTSMIEHHQSAIDMSRPAATNASHQEIKDLARAIITAQTKEVADMKQWQKDWGYAN